MTIQLVLCSSSAWEAIFLALSLCLPSTLQKGVQIAKGKILIWLIPVVLYQLRIWSGV